MSQYVQPSHFCCLPATILHAVVSILFNGGKMAAVHEPFAFSPWRALTSSSFLLIPAILRHTQLLHSLICSHSKTATWADIVVFVTRIRVHVLAVVSGAGERLRSTVS